MDLFHQRFSFWYPSRELTDQMQQYYILHYEGLDAPIDSLIADLSNHFPLERCVKAPENILLPEFYDRLEYVIYNENENRTNPGLGSSGETNNSPSRILYAPYIEPVRTEAEIAKAILVCRNSLYDFIINPSIVVMTAYCRESPLHLDLICNPPRSLIMECIKYNDELYQKYSYLFEDLTSALKINSHIIKYIDQASEELKLYAVYCDISSFKWIKEPSYEVCEYVAEELAKHYSKYLRIINKPDPSVGASLLRGIAYTKLTTGLDYSHFAQIQSKEYPLNINDFKLFNERIVDHLIKVPEFIFNLDQIPEVYWTVERLRKVLQFNPQILERYPNLDPELYSSITNKKYFPYIPNRYQSSEIKNLIRKDVDLYYLNKTTQKVFKDKKTKEDWEEALLNNDLITQDLCDRIFRLDPNQFKLFPEKFQTDAMIQMIKSKYHHMIPYIYKLNAEMALEIVEQNPDAIKHIPPVLHTEAICKAGVTARGLNLKWCMVITKEILNHIFKTTSGPRNQRFSFLQEYSQTDLLRILEVRPNLLMYLKPEQQTDTLIRKVLSLDGFVYQYVINKNPEYLELALANQPRAIKYK